MWLIEEIRKSSIRVLQTDMGSYHPEKEEAMSLREFLTRRKKDLNGLQINNATIEKAVKSMVGPDW